MKCNNFFCSRNNSKQANGCNNWTDEDVKDCHQRKAFNRFKRDWGGYVPDIIPSLNRIKKELEVID